ncbi:hypothetical protein GCM10011572_48840 [Pseudoduganella buxea]|uniref:Transposase n=1 Tax=Pseudoduganella buxea TaxID=1949069 RepID=A0ABQ1LBD0_9BURK|nr:hypothetical protein GCM10011572_48840 [Pseudoduganella buxea]
MDASKCNDMALVMELLGHDRHRFACTRIDRLAGLDSLGDAREAVPGPGTGKRSWPVAW